MNVSAQPETLRKLAAKRGIYVGTAVALRPLHDDPLYGPAIAREFNIIVAENAFKWEAVQPQRGKYNFTATDELVKFARKNGMQVRGHTLVWHNQLPAWLKAGTFSREELIAILREHIHTLVGRYRGQIHAWDVVNEAIDDKTGGYRAKSFWYKNLGADFIPLAFKFAREADPDVKLFYNDYSAEGMNAKSDGVYRMLRELKEKGVPVDGIGWQMHLLNGFKIEPGHQENATRLAALGLELAMTEVDVRITLPTTAKALQIQAEAYRQAMLFCVRQKNCKSFLTWGFTDKYSWIPGFFKGTGDALPFDAAFRPKPAYQALLESLAIPLP
jgi:endo-1,4-beta-xylanase